MYTKNLFVVLGLVFALTHLNVFASDCFQDPIYDTHYVGKAIQGVNLRDIACMDGSTVVTVLKAGEQVNVIAETDGWKKIQRKNGLVGWIGQQFISKVSDGALYVEGPYPTETTTTTPAPQPSSTPLDATTKMVVEAAGDQFINKIDLQYGNDTPGKISFLSGVISKINAISLQQIKYKDFLSYLADYLSSKKTLWEVESASKM